MCHGCGLCELLDLFFRDPELFYHAEDFLSDRFEAVPIIFLGLSVCLTATHNEETFLVRYYVAPEGFGELTHAVPLVPCNQIAELELVLSVELLHRL